MVYSFRGGTPAARQAQARHVAGMSPVGSGALDVSALFRVCLFPGGGGFLLQPLEYAAYRAIIGWQRDGGG